MTKAYLLTEQIPKATRLNLHINGQDGLFDALWLSKRLL